MSEENQSDFLLLILIFRGENIAFYRRRDVGKFSLILLRK